MSNKRVKQIYVKESTIPGIGKGLFTNKYIKNKSIITEFKGIVKKLDQYSNSRSSIYFGKSFFSGGKEDSDNTPRTEGFGKSFSSGGKEDSDNTPRTEGFGKSFSSGGKEDSDNTPQTEGSDNDEYILECYDNNLASFANDIIIYPTIKRSLTEILQTNEPFYEKYPDTKINSKIVINNNQHNVFLMAVTDINPGEEIFCHYGFSYWFSLEFSNNTLSRKIYECTAFENYIKEFYPTCTGYSIGDDLIIDFNDGSKTYIRIND